VSGTTLNNVKKKKSIGNGVRGKVYEETPTRKVVKRTQANDGNDEVASIVEEEDHVGYRTNKYECNNLAPWEKIW